MDCRIVAEIIALAVVVVGWSLGCYLFGKLAMMPDLPTRLARKFGAGSLILLALSGGQAAGQDPPEVTNITWFGAVGDGVKDNTPALQAAMDAAAALGQPIYIPTGMFRFHATVTLKTSIIGSRFTEAVLEFTGPGAAFQTDGPVTGLVFKAFGLKLNGNAHPDITGFDFRFGAHGLLWEGVAINGGPNVAFGLRIRGLHPDGSVDPVSYNQFNHLMLNTTGMAVGVSIGDDGLDQFANANTFVGGAFLTCGECLRIIGSGNTIVGAWFNTNIAPGRAVRFTGTGTTRNSIIGGYVDPSTTVPVFIDGSAASKFVVSIFGTHGIISVADVTDTVSFNRAAVLP